MTHTQAVSECLEYDRDRHQFSDCDGHLIDQHPTYASDVFWEVFTCDKCHKAVWTVEGRIHWWNFTADPSPERMARMAISAEGQKAEAT